MSEINYPSPEKMSVRGGPTAENGSLGAESVINSPASDSYQNRTSGMQMVDGESVPRGGGQVQSPTDK